VKKIEEMCQLGVVIGVLTLLQNGNGQAISLEIASSEAYNYDRSYWPARAHDDNNSTGYAAEDDNITINWIKFYLSGRVIDHYEA